MPQKTYQEKFFDACKEGDLGTVKNLLSIKVVGVDTRGSDDDQTAFMYALMNKKLEVAEFLLSEGAYIDAKDRYDKTALMHAAENGNQDVVAFLLSKGADVNDKDTYRTTALMYAAMNLHKDVVESLISKGADINAKDNQANTALQIAIESWNLERNSDEWNSQQNNRNPDDQNALNAQKELLKSLVSKGADISNLSEADLGTLFRIGALDTSQNKQKTYEKALGLDATFFTTSKERDAIKSMLESGSDQQKVNAALKAFAAEIVDRNKQMIMPGEKRQDCIERIIGVFKTIRNNDEQNLDDKYMQLLAALSSIKNAGVQAHKFDERKAFIKRRLTDDGKETSVEQNARYFADFGGANTLSIGGGIHNIFYLPAYVIGSLGSALLNGAIAAYNNTHLTEFDNRNLGIQKNVTWDKFSANLEGAWDHMVTGVMNMFSEMYKLPQYARYNKYMHANNIFASTGQGIKGRSHTVEEYAKSYHDAVKNFQDFFVSGKGDTMRTDMEQAVQKYAQSIDSKAISKIFSGEEFKLLRDNYLLPSANGNIKEVINQYFSANSNLGPELKQKIEESVNVYISNRKNEATEVVNSYITLIKETEKLSDHVESAIKAHWYDVNEQYLGIKPNELIPNSYMYQIENALNQIKNHGDNDIINKILDCNERTGGMVLQERIEMIEQAIEKFYQTPTYSMRERDQDTITANTASATKAQKERTEAYNERAAKREERIKTGFADRVNSALADKSRPPTIGG